ncbi:shikimate dehydrogenase [Nakamurella panacisegetis]|uniref:Shikimate dehydrogenase n=1 Tax=Nakamurella panacisegetis TaxID=1090615 RepID=A0A1H0QZE4_9ACTN|nr:shikimate dehydrogenase [Nakamurella panacisegetis]SDP22156.1 shikimate dehydrogenase [Nakamurella panacisegetis]
MISRPGTEARRAAVLGSPVDHSLSPALHRAGFAAIGLTGWTYEKIECDGERLPALVAACGPEWAGFSVTMPGKSVAAAVADVRSPRVIELGVANTLYRGPAGWYAENTDVDGVTGALSAVGLAPRRVLVLGGGGTARSVVAALAEMGVAELIVAGRRPQSTADCAALAARLGVEVTECGLDEESVSAAATGVDLVVSTIPAGGADHLADALAAVPALFDVVYHPWPTPLAAASPAGRVTVTGLDMLLHQAFRQFELFTARAAPRAQMRAGLRAASGTELPLPIGTPG